MPSTIIRTAQATTGASNRQDLRGFASSASPASTDPIAMGVGACDVDGLPLMGRTLHDANAAPTATDVASTALAAYTKRARIILQNLSDGDLLWFDFGGTAVAGASYKCFPGQILVFDGEACPADLVSVVADTGATVTYVAKDW